MRRKTKALFLIRLCLYARSASTTLHRRRSQFSKALFSFLNETARRAAACPLFGFVAAAGAARLRGRGDRRLCLLRDHRGRRYVIPLPDQTDEVFGTHRGTITAAAAPNSVMKSRRCK